MPLKKGNTNIGAIYKGTTQIAKVYKGTKLLFENAKWLDYLFEYIYHSLIPTTISGKTVQDKAKLTKISGNGVVENQWLSDDYYQNTTTNGVTISYDKNTHTLTLNGTASTTFNYDLNPSKEIFSGRKYLITAEMTETINSRFALGYASVGPYLGYRSDGIYNDTNSKTGKICALGNGGDNTSTFKITIYSGAVFNSLQVKNIQYIDLTLRFGTGNEPTTLTDNRIQALLNRGYIAYNTGSYKNSRVGEIECEPYNLCDGVFQIRPTDTSKRCIQSKLIPAIAGQTYVFEEPTFEDYQYRHFQVLDENGDFIRQEERAKDAKGTIEITLSANERYLRVQYWYYETNHYTNVPSPEILNTCVHVAGTRTGYAPYQAPTKITLPGLLELNGAINSHDTFEITNTGYVFTRNVGVVDLGTLNWTILSEGNFYCSRNLEWKKPANDNNIGNIVCHLYTQDTATNVQSLNNYKDKTIGLNVDPQIIVRDSAYTTAADFKTAMAGMYAYLELATPQVITIPKKHLGCVDLGSLNWNYDSGNARFLSSDALSNAALPSTSSTLANVYCGLYKTSATGLGLNNLEIALNPNGIVYVKDNAYTSAADFKSAMAGQYLFYETDAEVSDFDNIAQINAGGSITSNSEVLPNANFEIKCK